LSFENFKDLYKKKKMAVKHRGVLAAVKLGHTRIFINIKKKIHGIKSVISMSDSEQLRADGDIGHSTGQPEKYVRKTQL
jgi:hypothetical protein